MTNIKNSCDQFLFFKNHTLHQFWLKNNGSKLITQSPLSAADFVYVYALLGRLDDLEHNACQNFANFIAESPLAGRQGCQKTFAPHLSAYLLGALNLLAKKDDHYRKYALSEIKIDADRLIDSKTLLPKWPRILSHHVWRVSHWIGGIPSILLTFARHGSDNAISEKLVFSILQSCDEKIIAPETGLLKPYKNNLMQRAFQYAYRFRHNPLHGEIGGLAHLHWINHALNRKYVSADLIVERCQKDIQKKPFLENSPYCLDFDYLQLLRTAINQSPLKANPDIKNRLRQYSKDLKNFLISIPEHEYSLHRLPGALAALHEAELMLGSKSIDEIDCAPIDVINNAYWL